MVYMKPSHPIVYCVSVDYTPFCWSGWRHFVDSDISWTLFFKMGDISWTLSKGDFSWTLFGDISWTLLSTRSPLFW